MALRFAAQASRSSSRTTRHCPVLELVAYLCVMLGTVEATAGSPPGLSVGISRVDITPPLGSRMSGYFHERRATGTKDPLLAKVLYLAEGETRAAIVFCDLIGMPLPVANRVRAEASKRSGIPASHIGVACTHTHTAPLYYGPLHRLFHERAIAERGEDPLDFDYPATLASKIAGAVVKAAKSARPMTLEVAIGKETRLPFNRRFHMKSGPPVRFNPGQLNPDIDRAAGPIDPDVGVLMLRRDKKPVGALTVFALHLDTTGGTEFSADFPFYLEKSLRADFGESFASLFGAGTCGDINHIDVTTKERRRAPEIGAMLAQTVKATIPALRVVKPALAVKSGNVDAPIRKPADLANSMEKKPRIGTRELPFLETVACCTDLDLAELPPRLPLEVQVFRVGEETAIVLLPGEVFVEIGLAIKRASPFESTLVVELANDNPAYIPTAKAFREGSYETVNSRIEPGQGERLAEKAIELLRALDRE